MSKQELPIQKKVYERNSVSNVINKDFTQLIQPELPNETQSFPTVAEFFELYDELFFDIPKEGKENSHQVLIDKSSEYIGVKNDNNIDITLLQEEITLLREQLLTANQTIQDIKITSTTINK